MLNPVSPLPLKDPTLFRQANYLDGKWVEADSGQTIVVKNGTVLAVEAFEGTNEAIRRGGSLGKKNAIVIKVTKPAQDMRFDVPVIGRETLQVASEAKIRAIAVEAGRTLLLEKAALIDLAEGAKISLLGR